LVEGTRRVFGGDRQALPRFDIRLREFRARARRAVLAFGRRPALTDPTGSVGRFRRGAQGHSEVFDRFGETGADDVPVDLVLAVVPGSGIGDPLDRVGDLVGVHAGEVLSV